MKLPKIRNRIKAEFIDATPEGYALRILEYYRDRCNETWEVHGLSEGETRIYGMMNEHQKERAKELDKAIEILKRINELGYKMQDENRNVDDMNGTAKPPDID